MFEQMLSLWRLAVQQLEREEQTQQSQQQQTQQQTQHIEEGVDQPQIMVGACSLCCGIRVTRCVDFLRVLS